MNINYYLDPANEEYIGEAPLLLSPAIEDLLNRRRERSLAFWQIEQEKGFIKPTSLSTPTGQEMARIVFWRTVEEVTESLDSIERAHILEEIIDAINYLWSLFTLDSYFGEKYEERFRYQVISYFQSRDKNPREDSLSLNDLGHITRTLGRVTDLFRNRSWMNNPQDLYFSGYVPLVSAMITVTYDLLRPFDGWSEFWSYYIAKDEVLKFRLRTRY